MKNKSVLKFCMVIFTLVFVMIAFAKPVYAESIADCDAVLGTDVMIDEKIPNTVHTIILVIKIAAPVLIIVFGMMDLLKGIMAQKEEEIKKGQQTFIKRLIVGASIFFVVTLVQILISFVGDNDKKSIMDCSNCFINGNCTKRTTNVNPVNP